MSVVTVTLSEEGAAITVSACQLLVLRLQQTRDEMFGIGMRSMVKQIDKEIERATSVWSMIELAQQEAA